MAAACPEDRPTQGTPSVVKCRLSDRSGGLRGSSTWRAAYLTDGAVGASEQLTLDVLELETCPDDAFLLCSDGLYQSLSTDALGHALNLPAPQLALERLFAGALRGEARDNLTAVVIRQ